MKLRRVVPVAVLGVGGWVAWGAYWGDFKGPVTDAEARSHFARVVAAAQAKDFEALCGLNSSLGTCRFELQHVCPTSFGSGPAPAFPSGEELERLCRESVPSEPPTIIESRDEPPVGDSVGGRILVVQGKDGRGNSYETEVLVFRGGRRLQSQHTVFWSGTKFPAEKEGPIRVQPTLSPNGFGK